MNLFAIFSFPFMQRALIAGVLVSLCCALLGVSLVLKRYSMIGDGLSHVSFGALAIAVALGCTPTTDVDNYMFGSVLAMSRADVILSAAVSAAVLVLFVLFYHKLFAVTFDESFSRATGLNVDRYNTLLAVLTALTIVLGMRMMGAMLISSLIIFPALTAMRLFRSFRGVILCAAVSSVVCFCIGLTVSFVCSTPVGATVVCANLTLFLLSCALRALRR